MSTNLDDMLKEAPALTLEPFEAQTKSLPAESPVQIIEETQTHAFQFIAALFEKAEESFFFFLKSL